MELTPLATPADIRNRWLLSTPLNPTDVQLKSLIEDVEDAIAAHFPHIRTWIANEEIPQKRVTRVVVRIATRYLKNPEGVRQRAETQGPFTGTVTMAGDHPGEIYLTDADIHDLTPPSMAKDRGRAFTIVPAGAVCYG